MRAGHVHPDQLVAVQQLRGGAGAARDQVPEVQLVARAGRQQHAIAHAPEDGVDHHLGREAARDGGHAGHMAGLVAEEELERGVQVLHAGVGRRERRLDLAADGRDHALPDEAVHDHRAVSGERGMDRIDRLVGRESFELGGHAGSSGDPASLLQQRESLGWRM